VGGVGGVTGLALRPVRLSAGRWFTLRRRRALGLLAGARIRRKNLFR